MSSRRKFSNSSSKWQSCLFPASRSGLSTWHHPDFWRRRVCRWERDNMQLLCQKQWKFLGTWFQRSPVQPSGMSCSLITSRRKCIDAYVKRRAGNTAYLLDVIPKPLFYLQQRRLLLLSLRGTLEKSPFVKCKFDRFINMNESSTNVGYLVKHIPWGADWLTAVEVTDYITLCIYGIHSFNKTPRRRASLLAFSILTLPDLLLCWNF